MRIKLEPLLPAAGIGAVIWIIGSLAALAVGYRVMQTMFESPLFDPAYMETIDASTADPLALMFGESFRSTMLLSSAVNGLQCLTWALSGAVAGALYVIYYRRQDPMASGGEAGSGAAAGALAVITGYLVSTIISTIVMAPLVSDFLGQMALMGGPEAAQVFDQMGAFMVVMVAVSAICSIILYGVIGAITGALGALLGNAMVKPAA